MTDNRSLRISRQAALVVWLVSCLFLLGERVVRAQDETAPGVPVGAGVPAADDSPAPNDLAGSSDDPQTIVRDLLEAGGVIGWIILALSVATGALIVEHLLSIRRNALAPPGLAEQIHNLIGQAKYADAEQICRDTSSFLGHVLSAGLTEVGLGYSAVEKAMEDTSSEQAARLFRKIEYLSLIGAIAPMLGLLGTVLGMIRAFDEFKTKVTPQVAELAPGISQALVTTAMGLIVAVPAFAGYAIFRNRIDGLVAESTLMAEHVFFDFKRRAAQPRKSAAQKQRAAKPAE